MRRAPLFTPLESAWRSMDCMTKTKTKVAGVCLPLSLLLLLIFFEPPELWAIFHWNRKWIEFVFAAVSSRSFHCSWRCRLHWGAVRLFTLKTTHDRTNGKRGRLVHRCSQRQSSGNWTMSLTFSVFRVAPKPVRVLFVVYLSVSVVIWPREKHRRKRSFFLIMW